MSPVTHIRNTKEMTSDFNGHGQHYCYYFFPYIFTAYSDFVILPTQQSLSLFETRMSYVLVQLNHNFDYLSSQKVLKHYYLQLRAMYTFLNLHLSWSGKWRSIVTDIVMDTKWNWNNLCWNKMNINEINEREKNK